MLLNKSFFVIGLVFLALGVSAKELRDPTLPSKAHTQGQQAPQAQGQLLVLNSIVSSANSAYAVINNQILSVGDSIQGVKVVRITAGTVWLSDGRKLRLFQPITER
ncbi:MAG: MSHA biogenesis protein MshK [Shewanella sp.]